MLVIGQSFIDGVVQYRKDAGEDGRDCVVATFGWRTTGRCGGIQKFVFGFAYFGTVGGYIK